MTRSSRFAPAVAVFALVVPLMAASPAGQPDISPHYDVVLAEPTDAATVIAGGVLFRCEGTTCAGPRSRDRALRVCSELRRETGTITRFAVAGEALGEAQLSLCNG